MNTIRQIHIVCMKMNEYYIYFVLHLKYTRVKKWKRSILSISDVHFALSAYIGRLDKSWLLTRLSRFATTKNMTCWAKRRHINRVTSGRADSATCQTFSRSLENLSLKPMAFVIHHYLRRVTKEITVIINDCAVKIERHVDNMNTRCIQKEQFCWIFFYLNTNL